MIISHLLDKGNKVILEAIKRDIMKSLKIKGMDLSRINVHLKDDNKYIIVTVKFP